MDNHRRTNKCGDARCDCKCRDCCSCKPARCCKKRRPLPTSSCICPPGPPGPMGPPGPSGASGSTLVEVSNGQLKFASIISVAAAFALPAGDTEIVGYLSDAADDVASDVAVRYPLAEAVVFDSLAARIGLLTAGALPAGVVVEVTLLRNTVDTGLSVEVAPGASAADYGVEAFAPLQQFDVAVSVRNTSGVDVFFGSSATFLAAAVLSQLPTL